MIPAGTTIALPLRPDGAEPILVRLLAVPGRDLVRPEGLSPSLAPFRDAVLVDVRLDGRLLLPGAWAEPEVLERGAAVPGRPVRPPDLRMPAVIAGDGASAQLHWGETRWPLPFDDTVAIPASCRAGVHSTAMLRRLALVAAGARDQVGLTLWRDPSFEIPWCDVRLVDRARWWFEIAQVPAGMRYADAAAAQGVPVGTLPLWST